MVGKQKELLYDITSSESEEEEGEEDCYICGLSDN